jgi:hypothetical protein
LSSKAELVISPHFFSANRNRRGNVDCNDRCTRKKRLSPSRSARGIVERFPSQTANIAANIKVLIASASR